MFKIGSKSKVSETANIQIWAHRAVKIQVVYCQDTMGPRHRVVSPFQRGGIRKLNKQKRKQRNSAGKTLNLKPLPCHMGQSVEGNWLPVGANRDIFLDIFFTLPSVPILRILDVVPPLSSQCLPRGFSFITMDLGCFHPRGDACRYFNPASFDWLSQTFFLEKKKKAVWQT